MPTPGLRKFLLRCLKPVSFLFLLSFSQYSHAQNHQWSKSFANSVALGGNVVGKGIKTDASGNIYTVGYFSNWADFDPGAGTADRNSVSSNDIFLTKYDASGNYIYAIALGSTGDDGATCIAVDGSGNVYIAGYFGGTIDFDPGPGITNLTLVGGSADIFFAKYDASGNLVYARSMGSGNVDRANAIAVDGSGSVYITGYFQSTVDFDPGAGTTNLVASSTDIFIAKYDGAGDYVYAIKIGGGGSDIGNGIAVDASGNAYITGAFEQTVDFDPGIGTVNLTSTLTADPFFAKYDAAGNYVFAVDIPGLGAPEAGYAIALDGSSNVYISGVFYGATDFDPGPGTATLTSSGSSVDVYFAKYNSSGSYIYAKAIGGAFGDSGYGIVVDGSGNVCVTGSYSGSGDFDPGAGTANLSAPGNNEIYLAKYNSAGVYVYAKSIASTGNDIGYGLTVDASGNVHITGLFTGTVDFDPGVGTANLIAPSGTNSFVGKYDASGNYVWAKLQGGYSNTSLVDAGNAITRDAAGNIYVAGTFSGTVDFDPGAGVANLTSLGLTDIFLAKYSSSGSYIYAKAMSGTSNETAKALVVDAGGNVFLTGSFTSTVDFNPGPGVNNLVAVSSDIFIAKYDASGDFVFANRIGGASTDQANGIAIDGSNNIYLVGIFNGTVDFDPSASTVNLISSGQDIFLAKYDASGTYVYALKMGGTSTETGLAVAVDGSNNAYITGSFSTTSDFDPGAATVTLTSTGTTDIFLAKYDASGNYVFAIGMGGTAADIGNAIAIDASNNLYITGSFSTTVDFDPSGTTNSLTSAGGTDIFLAKYDASGNYGYAKRMGAASSDIGNAIAVEGTGIVYITGVFSVITDFDPDAGTANLTSAGSTDIFIASYDASGAYLFAKGMGGLSADVGSAIVLDASSNTYITGFFYSTVDFDPGAGSALLSSINSSDVFIGRFGLALTLPVHLLSFTVKPIQNETVVQINWSSSNQSNHSYFEVERSKDGLKYEAIGRRQGCANCSNLQNFELKDETPYRGRSYYQLKSVDLDGKIIYSKPISVVLSDKTTSVSLQVFPTITERAFDIQIKNTESKKQVSIQVLNASGVLIQQQKVWLNRGDNKLGYTLLNQPAGLYYIRVADTKNNNVLIGTVIKK